jgi:hypothetical protein
LHKAVNILIDTLLAKMKRLLAEAANILLIVWLITIPDETVSISIPSERKEVYALAFTGCVANSAYSGFKGESMVPPGFIGKTAI